MTSPAKRHAAFGAQVRARRLALKLTQSQLGQRVSAAAITIRKIEAGERRASAQMGVLLADALQIPHVERTVFLSHVDDGAGSAHNAAVDVADSAASDTGDAAQWPDNIARTEPLYGRSSDVHALLALMDEPGAALITLAGIGGVGKSALARAVFDALHMRAHVSATFADVSALSDAGQVLQQLVLMLGIPGRFEDQARPAERITRWIGNREYVLVLDGFESVKQGVQAVLGLMQHCPHLKLLITSRVRLRKLNERVYALGPLTIDDAVALFRARAEHADPKLIWREADAAAARSICERLDCLPLAVELVAARCALMTPIQLKHRLLHANGKLNAVYVADGVSDLPSRQRSLLSTLNWSYAMLAPLPQRALRQLAVFPGEFSIEAAEAVLALSGETANPAEAAPHHATDAARVTTWNALTLLLDASLLQRRDAPSPRFKLLDTVRSFALELCANAGETDTTEQRYLAWALEFARQQAQNAEPVGEPSALAAFQAEKHLLVHAVDMALARRQYDTALQLSVALGVYWHYSSSFAEGRRYLSAVLEHPVSDQHAWLSALSMSGHLAVHQADYAEASRLLDKAHSGYVALGDLHGQADTLYSLGWCHVYIPEPQVALDLFERAAALWRAAGNDKQVADAELSMAQVLRSAGIDVPRAERLARSTLATAIKHGDDRLRVRTLSRLTTLALDRGAYDEAARHLSEAGALLDAIHDMNEHAWAHAAWGELHLLLGDDSQSRAAFERALAIWSQESHAHPRACAETETQLALLALRRADIAEARRLFAASEMTLANRPLSIARLLNLSGLIELATATTDLAILHPLRRAVTVHLGEFAVRGRVLLRAAERAHWDWLAQRWHDRPTMSDAAVSISIDDITRALRA